MSKLPARQSCGVNRMLALSRWKQSIEIVQGEQSGNVNPYDRDRTQNIPVAVLRSAWHPKIAPYLANKGIKGMKLHRSHGFKCENYNFLNDLGFLELLSLAPGSNNHSGPMPISKLTRLKRLSIPFRHQHLLDFTNLTKLQSCSLQWNNKVSSIFESKSLNRLQLSGLNWRYANGLSCLTTLENLELSHCGIRSFDPINKLTNLSRLSLQVCHSLENLDGIEALQNLRQLHLSEVHKITSLECLRPLKNLEALIISDARDIKSVAPLEELKNLRAVWIAGTRTNIVDGDLTPLTKLPKLGMLVLGNKRHYSHKLIKRGSWKTLHKPDTFLVPA